MTAGEARALAYTVLAAPAEAELIERKSRFRCVLERVEDEEAARDAIARQRAEHRLGRHHCSAFVLGPDRSLRRSSDDGEPSGTAGTPMLDALLAAPAGRAGTSGLSDVVAVVTRWFGGILLGTGGLARAYGDAVAAALDAASFATRSRMRVRRLDAPHADAGRVEHELRARGLEVLGADYGPSSVGIRLGIPDDAVAIARADAVVAELARGRGLEEVGVEWVDSPLR